MFDDPQVKHRAMKVQMPHPTAGTVSLIGSPIKMSETPVEYRNAPPLLGQHTDEILRDRLGLDPEAIEALHRDRIV